MGPETRATKVLGPQIDYNLLMAVVGNGLLLFTKYLQIDIINPHCELLPGFGRDFS